MERASDKFLAKGGDVQLIAFMQGAEVSAFGPEQQSASGAMGCFEEEAGYTLFLKDLAEKGRAKKLQPKTNTILRESAGRGHGSVDDQNAFMYMLKKVTRATTLFVCGPEYIAHLQQSLRRVSAKSAFFMPEPIVESKLVGDVKDVLFSGIELYENMKENNVKTEDARIPLSLLTKTNDQLTLNARELKHLISMCAGPGVPSYITSDVTNIGLETASVAPKLVEKMSNNYEVLQWFPSSQLYALENETLENLISKEGNPLKTKLIDNSNFEMSEKALHKAIIERDEAELANTKHMHYTFLAPMSLMSFHQATRQRTWNQSVESIYAAAERGIIVVPPSIKNSEYFDAFIEQNQNQLNMYRELVEEGVPKPEAIGVVPHSLMVYDILHVNGWNGVHSIAKRTCKEAQWEVRDVAVDIQRGIIDKNPILGSYTAPQGTRYGSCPERTPCPTFAKNNTCPTFKGTDPKIFHQLK
jgi:thymidylate synthase ThyX